MAAAWLRPRVPDLLLILTTAAALPVIVNTQDLQCPKTQGITNDSPAFFHLDEQAHRSIRFSLSTETAWEVNFTLGEGLAESFTPRINLLVKKQKPGSQIAFVKISLAGEKKGLLLNSRVDSNWLEGDGQATLFLGESTLKIAFLNGESKFLQQLTDPKLEGLSIVQVKGNLQVEECEGPWRVPDAAAAITTVSTTTTTSAAPNADTTTTSEPTITTPNADRSTIFPIKEESTTSTTDDIYNATTSEDELPPPCIPAGDAVADDEVSAACVTPSNVSVIAVESSGQCVVPRWAWACAGLAFVFFVFIVGLIIYSITLYKRSWKNGNGSGGFGATALDMHYYEMRNNNLMIGNTVPRIVTPRPSSIPGLTPRHSINRMSHSLSPSRTTTPFPPSQGADLDDPASTLDVKEKSRSSKVSFAED